jgi:hypothetical protein
MPMRMTRKTSKERKATQSRMLTVSRSRTLRRRTRRIRREGTSDGFILKN